MIVAIDGPAGSGKTTIAKLLAKQLGILYLDTGAMYRSLTLVALSERIDVNDEEALAARAQTLALRFDAERVFIGDRDVSASIRTPEIDKTISVIVAHPKVRSVMVELQRMMAKNQDYVVEGRDITTVVFPQARYKFYLDADPYLRAERRFKELQAKGVEIDFKEMQEDLSKRDFADKNRKVGALTRCTDAHYVDTTAHTIDEVITIMLSLIRSEQKN